MHLQRNYDLYIPVKYANQVVKREWCVHRCSVWSRQ